MGEYTSTLLDTKRHKYLQTFLGPLLFYGCSAGLTILQALGSLAAQQDDATVETEKDIKVQNITHNNL